VAVNDVFHNLTAYRGYGHKAMVWGVALVPPSWTWVYSGRYPVALLVVCIKTIRKLQYEIPLLQKDSSQDISWECKLKW
jgi:hypothetical protein